MSSPKNAFSRSTVALAAALCALAGGARAEEKCGVCHPDARVAHETGVHARESVRCTSCHGGNAATLDTEAAHRGAFRSLAERGKIPAFCAECHADLAQMRSYNLAVDQYAIYLTSEHGRAVARGEDRAAVCTDCHGIHEIRGAGDPQSWVAPRNLPVTCGHCHGDPELMGDFGLDAGVITDYRSSIHGRALFEGGNQAAPNCTSCHGVHGAAPPGVGDIDKVCGACHVEERRAFLAGPHYEAMVAAGVSECAACHSNHAIRPIAAPTEICTECHEEGAAQIAVGEKIQALIAATQAEIEQAEELVARAENVPLHVEEHVARLEEARTYLTEALPLVHSVALEPVEQITRRARSVSEEVQHELYTQFDRGGLRLGLAVFWFYLLMTLAILFNYKRRLGREATS